MAVMHKRNTMAVLLLVIGCICFNNVTGNNEEGCMSGIEKCRTDHKQLAFDGIPLTVYSPYQLNQHCSGKGYGHCLNTTITTSSCTLYQKFTIEGAQLAEKYVCSEEAIRLYSEKNEYTDQPWESLKKFYMPEENKLCKEDFLIPSLEYMDKYEMIMTQKAKLGDEIAALEAQPDDAISNKDDQMKALTQKETDIQEKADKEREHYCNYMYVYQECIELAAKRHCNETIAHWQYEMVSQHFTPHFKHMKCHIGQGMKPLHVSAIVIVSVILGLIFSLALFCGIYEKCFEKIKICRRNNSADDLEALANNGDKRQNVMLPGENGLPQRTGSSSKPKVPKIPIEWQVSIDNMW